MKPNLENIPPYKWILDPDEDGIKDAFTRISKRVKDVVCPLVFYFYIYFVHAR